MSSQNSSKAANPPPVKMTPAGRAYAEQERRTAKRDPFLKAWYNGELNSGLVFNCRIDGLPDDTFQVTEFDLQEGLSELFTLTLHAVSSLLDVDFHDILGGASSLTVKRDGIKIREVQGLLASAENLNTDGVKT